MEYIVILILLFILELLYFKIADRFNIIDEPNERSSHSSITLRGGGIIFYLGVMFYFFMSGFQYSYFFLGLTLMTVVSFIDDIYTLSNKIRLTVHFSSVLLLALELNIFSISWFYLVVSFIIVVGVINAYNFMDGINGITVSYSVALGILLLITNCNIRYIDMDLILYVLLALFVFAYFNFRQNARCFSGDVGSVAIAYIFLFILGTLILNTGNLLYILFLSVYGIDSVWTIVHRLLNRENIFHAHRSHLYQYLANEANINKLLIAFIYGALQFIIGIIVIRLVEESVNFQVIFAVSLLSLLSMFYLSCKNYVIKKYVRV